MSIVPTAAPWSCKEKGMTLFMVAALLFVLLGMAAVCIDLVAFYVNRSEAQRAADAAALAAARKLVTSGYVTGGTSQATATTLATQEAIVVGAENIVYDAPAQIADSDVSFDFSVPNNPRVTVMVQRTAAAGNPVPTYFGKAIGFAEVDISAVATAEAYTPGSGQPPVCVGCIKPWIMPNCDPEHDNYDDTISPLCPAGTDPYVLPDGSVANETVTPDGVLGQLITLKYGTPQDAPAPSQFYPIQIPPGTEPEICPECAANPGGSEGPGAALYRHNIACCNTNRLVCGQTVNIEMETGNMVGPTGQGVKCLIHQGNGNQGGQDTIEFNSVVGEKPYQIHAGDNNPLVQLGKLTTDDPLDTSSSVVTVPLYDGHVLCPGASCGTTVTIVGFLELFLDGVHPPQNTVTAYILSVSGCGNGGSTPDCNDSETQGGMSGGSVGTGGQLVPIRLIRN